MRIVSWNCARGPLEKKLLALDSLSPDLVVLSESPPPKEETANVLWFPSGVSRLGVQVITYGPYSLGRLPAADLPSCVNPVRVDGPVPFNLLATWTWPAPTYVKAFLNALDAYENLMASGPMVIAGDFNGNPTHDKPGQRVKWTDAFARLEKNGLVSAYHHAKGVAFGKEPDPTHRYKRDPSRPFHIDYCFVPSAWAQLGCNVQVAAGMPWDQLSDHSPVVVEMLSVSS
jgi:hypothetical protein